MPRYEVRTIEWMPCAQSERPHKTRGPKSETVSTHAAYAEAVAVCDEVNAKAWANLDCNPFLHGGETLFFKSTFPPGPFCDYLEDRGIDLPAHGPDTDNAGWVEWYKAGRRKRTSLKTRRKRFTPAQMAAIREVMNLVRFAEVVEALDVTSKGYLVQELNWNQQRGLAYSADPEGGRFVAFFRSRSKAEARYAELDAACWWRGDYDPETRFSTEGRKGATEPHRTGVTETPFYEVVEVDLDIRGAGVMGGVAHVIYRQAYTETRMLCSDDSGDDIGLRVALGAYLVASAAEAKLGQLMRVAHRTAKPFELTHCRRDRILGSGVPWRAVPQEDWGHPEWHSWYDAEAPHLTDDQRAEFWALFDARPLYGIYEVPLGDD